MSELSISNTSKKSPEFCIIFHLIFNFCFLIISNPIYFTYFIFFFPYLVKILYFLSPLFITTSLLLLSFLAFHSDSSSESKMCFLPTTCQVVFEEFQRFPEHEAYKIMFETYNTIETTTSVHVEVEVVDIELAIDKHINGHGVLESSHEKYSDRSRVLETSEFLKEKKELQKEEPNYQAKALEYNEVDEERNEKHNKVKDVEVINETARKHDSSFNMTKSVVLNSPELGSNLGSFGSMRKEKEWRRTLACKLFEERHNVDGGGDQGMDSLWETYDRTDQNSKVKAKSEGKKGKRYDDEDEDEDEDEEDEDGDHARICCLQAFKFSAGKMNLGMRQPNLVKISKALKGFGWLNQVKKSRKKDHY